VNFVNAVDAERALDTLNNVSIRGKPCRIMWSQRDPTIRKSGIGMRLPLVQLMNSLLTIRLLQVTFLLRT